MAAVRHVLQRLRGSIGQCKGVYSCPAKEQTKFLHPTHPGTRTNSDPKKPTAEFLGA